MSDDECLLRIISGEAFSSVSERIQAINKLAHREDDAFISAVVGALDINAGQQLIDLASRYLEQMGAKAIPALVISLQRKRNWLAADVLSQIGGPEAQAVIEKALTRNPNIPRLKYALERILDPIAAKEREERVSAEVKTTDPGDTVRAVFEQFAPKISILPREAIDKHYRDWASGHGVFAFGSQSHVQSIILAHLWSLKWRDGYTFRIKFEDRWECVIVHAFYQRVANTLVVWRGIDFYGVAHT